MGMQIFLTVEFRDCDRPFHQIFRSKLHF